MAVVSRTLWALYSVVNGVHSGIPLCCVGFFAARLWRNPDAKIAWEVQGARGGGDRLPPQQYVQCGWCFTKQAEPVPIRNNGGRSYWIADWAKATTTRRLR